MKQQDERAFLRERPFYMMTGFWAWTVRGSYDKMNKKPVLKTSICTGEQVAGFQDIHTGKIEEIMLIKQTGDIDTFKQMYGIDGEIPKVY